MKRRQFPLCQNSELAIFWPIIRHRLKVQPPHNSGNFLHDISKENRYNEVDFWKKKIEVINDPLGQPTVAAGRDFRLILQFWHGRRDGRKDVRRDRRITCVNIVITSSRDCGQPRGSKEFISPKTPPYRCYNHV